MAYEIALRGTTLGELRETKLQEPYAPLVMTADELAAVHEVIHATRTDGALDGKGAGIVVFGDAKIHFSGLRPDGDVLRIEGGLADACVAIFAIATAGNAVIEADTDVALVTTRLALVRARELEDFGRGTVLVPSPAQLLTELAASYDAATSRARR